MTPKESLYLTLCGTLCSCLDREDYMLEHEPEMWALAREIDTWLTTYVRDDRVSVAQFQRNCERLLAIYVSAHPLE